MKKPAIVGSKKQSQFTRSAYCVLRTANGYLKKQSQFRMAAEKLTELVLISAGS